MEARMRGATPHRRRQAVRLLGTVAVLGLALAVPFVLEVRIRTLFWAALIAFLAAIVLSPWQRLRGVLLVLAVAVLGFLAIPVLLLREPYVSLSAPSQDGRIVAEVKELLGWIDFNFEVRLKRHWLGLIPRYETLFRSPDEGPPGAERLLWSKDGRHLLLVGTRFLAMREEACLASGDWLYLLVDTQARTIHTNSKQVRDPQPFSIEGLRAIDFGVPLTRGKVEARPGQGQKCGPSR